MDQEDEIMKTIKEITERKQNLEKQKAKNAVGNPQQKKKVYRSIFTPHSDESDTDSDPDSTDKSLLVTPKKVETNSTDDKGINQESESERKQGAESKQSHKNEDTSSPDMDPEKSSEHSAGSEQSSLSPQEKTALFQVADRLEKQLSEGVVVSSEEQVQFYMGPYGMIKSPFKKSSSFQQCARGVKRSPR